MLLIGYPTGIETGTRLCLMMYLLLMISSLVSNEVLAIFALKTVVSHFNKMGSSVFLASLDITKAFDSLHHDKLFKCLYKIGLPEPLVEVLCNWYGKLFVSVCWANSFSYIFTVTSGVRRGGVLSPSLFNVFINVFIVLLRMFNVCCHIHSVFRGCLLYADDMILICPSVQGLPAMLNECVQISSEFALEFNARKSYCML